MRTIGRRPARIAELEEYVGKLTELLDNRDTEFDGGVRGGISWLEESTGIPIYVAATGPKMIKGGDQVQLQNHIDGGVGAKVRAGRDGQSACGVGGGGERGVRGGCNHVGSFRNSSRDGAVAAGEHVSKHAAGLLSQGECGTCLIR